MLGQATARGLWLTLEWCRGRLGHVQVLLVDQIDGLVLSNLHTRAHITLPMKKEGESTGQMLTERKRTGHLVSRLAGSGTGQHLDATLPSWPPSQDASHLLGTNSSLQLMVCQNNVGVSH